MSRLSSLGVLAYLTGTVLGAALGASSQRQSANLTYEYIVVGSGAGGGPLASRLARAGHSVLLIEAGDDQGTSDHYAVPAFDFVAAEDPLMRWDFYVNHYQDQARAQRDPKYVYQLPNGTRHAGLHPPLGAKPLGILYPRAATLGGGPSTNDLIWRLPGASDWDAIANITRDQSWSSSNMQQYIDRVAEWLPTSVLDPSLFAQDRQLVQQINAGAELVGLGPDPADPSNGFISLLNSTHTNFSSISLTAESGARYAVRDFIVDTVNKGYSLTVRTNCHVTKLVFDSANARAPRATGVQFLDGQHLYSASPLAGGKGVPGTARATKEVILAGGVYNSAQILKLSGIGPSAELTSLGIKTLLDLPGVGANMQDRYEVSVNVVHQEDFTLLGGCDYALGDECYQTWANPPDAVNGSRGTYASNGVVAGMALHSDYAANADADVFIFGEPSLSNGYEPGWAADEHADHKHFSWHVLKAHSRNTAGTVRLRSADPLDTPRIDFHYFDTGVTADGADAKDLGAIVQGVKMARQALANYRHYSSLGGSSFTEQNPGASVKTDADLEQYVRDHAWGHHACCTAAIGATGDVNAVLDSQFRVRGALGLRVVDASVFPKIPGAAIQAPIIVASEKAADVILNGK